MTKRSKKPIVHRYDPQEALTRYRELIEEETYTCIAAVLGQPIPQALRINHIKGFRKEDLERWKIRYGWDVTPVPFCPAGWQVTHVETSPSQTVEHLMGAYYIQDASSMLPSELFGLQKDHADLVLDMAASPGGKTTHLIDRLDDRGFVMANDASRSRIQALRVALERWGSINSAVACHPGEFFGAWFPSTFDRVLLDAPCSMEGLRTSESHPMRPVLARERDELASRQTRLLMAALRAVKTGGQVVYSTCTLAPEEDEKVLLAMRRKYGQSIEVMPVPVAIHAPPIELPEARSYPDLRNALRIWPHLYNTAGFFTALIRKNDRLDEHSELKAPKYAWEARGGQRTNSRDMAWIKAMLADRYGFDLEETIHSQGLIFWTFGERFVAVPEIFMQKFSDFPVISCGMELGSRIKDRLMLTHEWAGRFGHLFQSARITIPPEKIADWLKGHDLFESPPISVVPGELVCCYQQDGLFLGRGKVVAGHIKNLLPRRLVG